MTNHVYKNGLGMYCYVDTAGVGGSSWADGNGALEDLTVNQTKNSSAIKNRASGDEKKIFGQRVRSIDLTLSHDPSDALFAACKANYESETPTDFFGIACMDGPIPAVTHDSVGAQIDVICTEFSQTQPLEDGSSWKVKLEPAAQSTTEPAHATVAPV